MHPGVVIAAHYMIEKRVGAGAMGVVYRAIDTRDGTPVAIKVAQHADNHEHLNRFSREARALSECLAVLAHPGIVRYVGHGISHEHRPFLIMEWLDGCELRTQLQSTNLSEQQTLDIAIQLSDALAAVHENGVIHRDIKPSNIFLIDSDLARPKLLDFGLAQLDRTVTMGTRTGHIMGTPSYMAPEQATANADIDHRADLYALGAVLFACLTGRPPFLGPHIMAVLYKVQMEQAPRIRTLRADISPRLEELISSLLSKTASNRPASAAVVRDELRRIRAGEHRQSQPKSSPSVPVTSQENRYTTIILFSEADIPQLHALGQKYDGEYIPLTPGVAMLSFSAQQDLTLAATRAAHCALTVRAQHQTVSIAIATGRDSGKPQTTISDVLERAISLMGEPEQTVDIPAIPLMNASPPGVLNLDPVSASLLKGRFRIRRDSEGRFTLLGEHRNQDTLREFTRIRTTCIGRERELMMLQTTLDECVSDNIAHLVLLTGPPGSGKSRIAYELVRRARDDEMPVRVVIARADSLRAGSPFGLLSDLLGHALDIPPSMPITEQQAQIIAHLGKCMTPGLVEHTAAFLCELVGAPFSDKQRPYLTEARADPRLMNDRMREAWEDWLDAELKVGPVLCVLDDLQWSDEATIKFLEVALRRLRDRPFMAIILARSEAREMWPRLWQAVDATQLSLRPLSARSCTKIVKELSDITFTDRLTSNMVERCGGNPFFLEELIRHAAHGHSDDLPESVLAMVSARLNALPPLGRRILRAGSVFGAAFSSAALAALIDLQPSTLSLPLSHLVDENMLDETRERRTDNDIEYRFRHEFIREAAYGMLTDEDRRAAHEHAGRWLENMGERDPVRLAEHYKRAALPELAIPWFRRAARHALDANDLQGVVNWAEQGIRCGATGEILGTLRMMQAEAHNWSGAHERARMAASEAMDLLTTGSGSWSHSVHLLAWAAQQTNEREPMIHAFDSLVTHAPEQPDTLYLISLAHSATVASVNGSFVHAMRLQKLIEAFSSPGISSRRVRATIAHMHAVSSFSRCRYEMAARWSMQSIDEWTEVGNQRMICLEEGNLAVMLCRLGQYDGSLDILESGLEYAESVALKYMASEIRHSQLDALTRNGDLDRAQHLLSQIPQVTSQHTLQDSPDNRVFKVLAARLALVLADRDQLNQYEQTLHTGKSSALRWEVAFEDSVHAQLLLALGRSDQALKISLRGMEIMSELSLIQEGEEYIRLTHAEALHANGHHDDAVAAIRAARDILLSKARHIENPEWRDSFLTRVEENRRILELIQQWT